MLRRSHKPERMCLGCMTRDAKDAMVRVAVANATLVIDQWQTLAGRGGYLHRDESCLRRFERGKVREFRSLKRKSGLDERLRITELMRGVAG